MAQTLEYNKNVTAVVPVTIPTFDDDLKIIQALDDEPNDVGGMTAAELKAKFDEGNITAQQYINDVLIPTVIADDLTEQSRQAAEAERVANEIERVTNEQNRETAEAEREQIIAKVENLTVSSEALEYGEPASAEVTTNPETGGLNVHFGLPMGKDGLSFLPVIEGDDVPDGVEAWIDPSIEPTDGLYSYTKEQTDKLLQRKVNPNLLDNACFGNPVDQRGGYVAKPGGYIYGTAGDTSTISGTLTAYLKVTSHITDWYVGTLNGSTVYFYKEDVVRGYTGTGYGIDRWHSASGIVQLIGEKTVTFRNTYTSSSDYFRQYLETPLPAGTYTLSVLTEKVEGRTRIYFSDKNGNTVKDVYLEEGLVKVTATFDDDVVCRIQAIITAGGSAEIKAAKLELGDQQTLAHQDENGNWVLNEITNKAEEEFKCIHSTADPSDTYANVPVGGVQMELLWENASPRSEFVEQALSIDCSQYDGVQIDCYEFTDTGVAFSGVILFNNFEDVAPHCFLTAPNAYNKKVFYRNATYRNGSFGFTNAKNTSDNTTNAEWCIPYRIYGIKGVKIV